MAWSAKQQEAMKNVLCDWRYLSRGDISIICANLRQPGEIWTSAESAHAKFWDNLVRIGWAEMLYHPIDPELAPVEHRSYRLTMGGLDQLPRFLVHYDLLNMGACTPAIDREKNLARTAAPKRLLLRSSGLMIAACIALGAVILGIVGAGAIWSLSLFAYATLVGLLTRVADLAGLPSKALQGIIVGSGAVMVISLLFALGT
jgi:hypothetical protein